MLVGSTPYFSLLEGVSVSAKYLKLLLCVSVDGEPGPCLKDALESFPWSHIPFLP